MKYNVKEASLKMGNTEMAYVSFGTGTKPLVIIPGLSLKRVKGSGQVLARMYRIFANDYRVYVFDRKEEIPEDYTIKGIAKDVAFAMYQLELSNAVVFGVSQGGMIAQYLAVHYPVLVKKLILAVTMSRQNDTTKAALNKWIELSDSNNYEGLLESSFEMVYSEKLFQRYKKFIPLVAKLGMARDLERFSRLAKSCFTCDVYEDLDKIQCPVLVLGGRLDKIVPSEAVEEIAEKLNCPIYIYEDYGHSVYEEAHDFNERIYQFLNGEHYIQ